MMQIKGFWRRLSLINLLHHHKGNVLDCRGLAQALQSDSEEPGPAAQGNLVFFMETKCRSNKLRGLGLTMGFKFYTRVDADGMVGGIWAVWDDCYGISFIKIHSRCLLLKVVDERGIKWLLMLLYGHPNLRYRAETWAVVAEALEGWSLPILVMGDFNQVLFPEEKSGKGRGNVLGVSWLKDFVGNFQLKDVDSCGVFILGLIIDEVVMLLLKN